MNKADVVAAAVKIGRASDPFDQTTRGQCRKLVRQMKPVPANQRFEGGELKEAMEKQSFTPDFIQQVFEELI